tara:strand:+ start:1597 stop:2673 length:1077 start_codon:yes stop_codon:yes gene_type:complete
MNISTVTSYISDTAANILATDPTTAKIGVASDTGQLFMSDGKKWLARSNSGTIDLPWAVPSGEIISQSPMLHFDAFVHDSLTNNTGDTPNMGHKVSEWRSNKNFGAFIEKRIDKQPTYTKDATSKNLPGLLFNGQENMSLDRYKTSMHGLPLTIFTVYTPTRDSRTLRVHGGSGGTYSISELGNHTNTVWADRVLRGSDNNTVNYTAGTLGLQQQHVNNHIYLRTGTNIGSRIDLPRSNQPKGDLFDKWNDEFLGKTQIHVCKLQFHDNAIYPNPHIDVLNTHLTWSIYDDQAWSDTSTQHVDTGLNLRGLQLGNEKSYNTLHELIIFNHGLISSEINEIGSYLFDKWCENDQTLHNI